MSCVRPRRLCHEGALRADGMLLGGTGVSNQARIERALTLYDAGAQVQQVAPDLWLIRWSHGRTVDARCASGAPAVRVRGHLSAVPLDPRELDAVDITLGPSVLWVRGGVLQQTPLSACTDVDLASFISLPDIARIAVSDLADPPITLVEPEVREPLSARDLFGDAVPPPSKAQEEMLESLRSRARTVEGGRSGSVAGARAIAALRGITAMAGSAAAALRGLVQLLGSGSQMSRAARGSGRGRGTDLAAPMGAPGWVGRLWTTLKGSLAWLALRSPLGGMLTFRQARYMRDLLDRFAGPDLMDALRHAIPLDAAGHNSQPALPSLSTPGPRSALTIHSAPTGAGTSMLFGGGLYQHLQQTYRAAAQRLTEQGKLYEAAWVYVELLKDPQAAIAVLEQAAMYREAAELAEGHKLPAGLIVRLWFLAKDVDRAVAHAVAHNAFADAVRRLAANDRVAADALRLHWANRLAEAGEYAGAVDALWPVEQARHLALSWMDRVIAAGGVVGARMLARAVRVRAGDAALEAPFRALLASQETDGAACRVDFARELVRDRTALSDDARRYVPAVLRAVVCDASLEVEVERELERHSPDRALAADLPTDKAERAARAVPSQLDIMWQAEDRGTLPTCDVVRLPTGGYAVALGELGVRLLTRDGRTRAHLDHPAERLVVSDSGLRALALCQRGDLSHVARVDLLAGRAQHWADLRLRAMTDSFDGERWFVQQENKVLCLDAQADGVRTTWSVQDDSFDLLHLVRDPTTLRIVAYAEDDAATLWSYEVPALTLRKRAHVGLGAPGAQRHVHAFAGSGALLHVISHPDSAPKDLYVVADHLRAALRPTEGFMPVGLRVKDDWAVVVNLRTVGGSQQLDVVLDVVRLSQQRRVMRLEAQGSNHVSTHIADERITIADDLGRLVTVRLADLQVERSLRLMV